MDVGCTNDKLGGYAKLFDVRGWGYLTGTGHGGLGLPPKEAYEIQKANAALAAAAPEMLDALKAVEADAVGIGSGENAISDKTRLMVEAAILKAEGRQP